MATASVNGHAYTSGQPPIDRLIARLEASGFDPRATGAGSYESRCPGHDGSRRNLTITEAEDGTVLVHCHHDDGGGGCSPKTIVEAVGLELRDLFPPTDRVQPRKGNQKATGKPKAASPKPKAAKPGNNKPGFKTAKAAAVWLCKKEGYDKATAHLYPDADKEVRIVVYRFDGEGKPKTYRPVYRDASTKTWKIGDPPDRLFPLYSLPAVLLANRVWFVEGEKCAQIVERLGLPSTTTAHGAKAPHKTDFSPLVGKEVVILPDNDEAGEAYLENLRAEFAKLDPKPRVKVFRLDLKEEGDDVEQWVKAKENEGKTPEEIREELELVASHLPEADEPAKGLAPGDGRPQIEINTERHEVLEQAIKALTRDEELYSRNGDLVVVVEEDRDAKTLGTPKIVVLAEATIGCMLTRNAELYAWRKDKTGEDFAAPAHPPDWLIKSVRDSPAYPGIRRLLAVAECPFLRPDGSIVEATGYDPETRILYRPTIEFPKVADRPTKGDAEAAWSLLQEPIKDFPFATIDDRIAWLAGLLTALARRSIDGAAPGLAVNGNRAGTGKGLLIDTIGILVSGRNISTSSYPDDKPEADKAKLALGLSGRPLVHFDNLDEGASYGGGAVDSMLTSHTVGGRVLGESRDVEDVPLRVTFFLSGNNISPYKDAYRRWLPCNLMTELERPEERHDLGEERLRHHVLERRGELVHAALTILRAHAVAGRPKGEWATLGSFEEWDPIVRGAVWFATGRDCCKTRRQAADESPERLAKIQLLKGWLELPGGCKGGITASEAAKLVTDHPNSYLTLREAFTGMTRDGKVPTGSKIGAKIRGMKNSVTDGMRFVVAGESHKTTLWMVEVSPQTTQSSQTSTNQGGDGGHSGDDSDRSAGDSGFNSDVMECGCEREAPGERQETSPLSPPSPPTEDFEEFTV